MSEEFTYEDGRKAEKVEIDQGKSKVIEIYVEPKKDKKLAQRITERYCVCEREIETLDETTGEVVDRVIEKLTDGGFSSSESIQSSSVERLVEEKIKNRKINLSTMNLVLVGIIVAQLVGLGCLLFVL